MPCTRAQAEEIDASDDLAIDAVLATSEEDEATGRWRLDAYFDGPPSPEQVAAVVALIPGAEGAKAERLPDEDWLTLSQAGLQPIREGRFVVHTQAFPAEPPPGGRAFRIEAAQAFGTGHHETTSGCLAMLERLNGEGERFDQVVDIGTGTGLLAFAALELWPEAYVLATDIDPVAIEVTRENMAINSIGSIDLAVADGALKLPIAVDTQFDLIIANVLAGPLISMAAELAAIAAPRATIVLAGLLETQREAVVAAYEGCGCTLAAADRRGDWTILCLTAGAERFVPASPPDPRGREGWALDL